MTHPQPTSWITAPLRTTFGYVTVDHPRLDRFQNAISAFCGVLAVISILSIGILTLWEVFSRTLFRVPVGWIPGFIEEPLMVIAAFFGLVTAYRSGAHVAIVSLFNKFNEPIKKILLIFSYAVVILCLASLMISGWRAMMFSFEIGEIMPPGMAELSVPTWIWKAPIPLATGLAIIVVLIDLYREITSSWRIATTNYESGQAGADIQNAPDERDATKGIETGENR